MTDEEWDLYAKELRRQVIEEKKSGGKCKSFTRCYLEAKKGIKKPRR